MGFGFASAASLVAVGLGNLGSNEPPIRFGTRLGGSCVIQRRVLTLNPLAGFAGDTRREGRDRPIYI